MFLCASGLLLLLVFAWTRIHISDHIYFFGDGTFIVALVQEMLRTGDWTADAGRILDRFEVQAEWQGYSIDRPEPGGHYFNLSGYVVLLTLVCQVFQWLGLDALSVPAVARILNFVLQAGTLVLLYLTGRRLGSRELGVWSAVFFVMLPLAVTEAQYERPECWLAFLGALMLYATLLFSDRPKTSMCVIGIALGLSAAVKPSQLFLLLVPGFLLLQGFLESARTSLVRGLREYTGWALLLLLGLVLAFYTNVPFVFDYWDAYLSELGRLNHFYDTSNPLFLSQVDGYWEKTVFLSSLFWKPMGLAWCGLIVGGMVLCMFWRQPGFYLPAHFRASLCVPPLFLFVFLITKVVSKENIFERFFTSTEPMMCLLSGLALCFLRQQIRTWLGAPHSVVASLLLAAGILLQPAVLNYRFVEHHIRQKGFQFRLEFQQNIKKDFPGFWIKNVHITYSITPKVPERPANAPRIYQIEDYNQAWTDAYLEYLKVGGFVHMATYCSDFSELAPGNHTLYHASAKNHYLVRRDEWPAGVAPDYFVTNCQ